MQFLILSYQIHPIIRTMSADLGGKERGGRRMQVTLIGFDSVFRFVFLFLNEGFPDSRY